MLLGDRSKSGNFSGARVGEQNVAFLLLHGGVQSVEIGQLRDVSLDAGDILADLPGREVELALTAAGDEDVSLLGGESLGGGEANTTVAPCDDCDSSFQLCHRMDFRRRILMR